MKIKDFIKFYEYLETPNLCLECDNEVKGRCWIWCKNDIRNYFLCRMCYTKLKQG